MNRHDFQTYPYSVDTPGTVDPNKTIYTLADFWGPTSNGTQQKPRNPLATPPAYLNQNNFFIIERVEETFKEIYNVAELERIFPLRTANSQKELTTTLSLNQFMAQKSPPGSPTMFTTTRLTSFMNSYDWAASGFQLPFQFFLNEEGRKLYRMFVSAVAFSLDKALRVEIYKTLNKLDCRYLNWLMTDMANNDVLLKILNRQVFYWNKAFADKYFGLQKIEVEVNDEENNAGLTSNYWIIPPQIEIYIKWLPESTANYLIGQYGNKDGMLNKPNPIDRIKTIGNSPVFVQGAMKLAYNVIWNPLANLASVGGHEAYPHAYKRDIKDYNPKDRWFSIFNAKTNAMHRLDFADGLAHAISLINGTSDEHKPDIMKKLFDDPTGNYIKDLSSKIVNGKVKQFGVETLKKSVNQHYPKSIEYFEPAPTKGGVGISYQWLANFIRENEDSIQTNTIGPGNRYIISNEVGVAPSSQGDWIYAKSSGFDENYIKYVEHIITEYKTITKSTTSELKLNATDFKFTEPDDLAAFFTYATEYYSTKNKKISIFQINKNLVDAVLKTTSDSTEKELKALFSSTKSDTKGTNYKFWIRSEGFTDTDCLKSIEVPNPAHSVINNLKECDIHYKGETTFLTFLETVYNYIKIRDLRGLLEDVFKRMVSKGIEPGFNVLLTRFDRTYNTLNMYRVRGNGGTGKRIKFWDYAKIYDDESNELHQVELRGMIGFRLESQESFSIVRNVAVLSHICGEGTDEIKNFRQFEEGSDSYIDLADLKKLGDYYSWIVKSDLTFNDPIVFSKASECKDFNFGKYNNNLYETLMTHRFELKAYVESQRSRNYAETLEVSRLKNYITRPEPHDEPDGYGKVKSLRGNDVWRTAHDGCNDERFGNERITVPKV